MHSHLARQPVPAHQLDPGIPEAVSDIVARLMAKMPEDRYQSARGCAHDLRVYDQAIDLAAAAGRVREEAVAKERAASVYTALGAALRS